MVHSREDYESALSASQILFGHSTSQTLHNIDEETFLQVFEGVPQFLVSRDKLAAGIKAVDLLAEETRVFPSKGEMRKTVQAGGVSINKDKLQDFEATINSSQLIAGKYILAQRGKKNYFLLVCN